MHIFRWRIDLSSAMHVGGITGWISGGGKPWVSVRGYCRPMIWTSHDRLDRDPELQRGWEIIGLMVKRRRHRIGWSQRDLSRACGLAQSAISRLETGKLSGVRFGRFAKLVAAMNGLDPDAPHPPRPMWVTGGWD